MRVIDRNLNIFERPAVEELHTFLLFRSGRHTCSSRAQSEDERGRGRRRKGKRAQAAIEPPKQTLLCKLAFGVYMSECAEPEEPRVQLSAAAASWAELLFGHHVNRTCHCINGLGSAPHIGLLYWTELIIGRGLGFNKMRTTSRTLGPQKKRKEIQGPVRKFSVEKIY